jgi:hypothetical protein
MLNSDVKSSLDNKFVQKKNGKLQIIFYKKNTLSCTHFHLALHFQTIKKINAKRAKNYIYTFLLRFH